MKEFGAMFHAILKRKVWLTAGGAECNERETDLRTVCSHALGLFLAAKARFHYNSRESLLLWNGGGEESTLPTSRGFRVFFFFFVSLRADYAWPLKWRALFLLLRQELSFVFFFCSFLVAPSDGNCFD